MRRYERPPACTSGERSIWVSSDALSRRASGWGCRRASGPTRPAQRWRRRGRARSGRPRRGWSAWMTWGPPFLPRRPRWAPAMESTIAAAGSAPQGAKVVIRALPGGGRAPPRWWTSDDAEGAGAAGGLGARVHVELAEDVGEVGRDRLLSDEQPLGDLAVGQPLGEEAQDLGLARGQAGRVLDAGRRGRRRELEPGAPGERLDRLAQRARAERGGGGVRLGEQP